jgi:hypothetical protein
MEQAQILKLELQVRYHAAGDLVDILAIVIFHRQTDRHVLAFRKECEVFVDRLERVLIEHG